MALSPGTRLGTYEITGLLGAGGMGEVYRATDTELKRQVALKVLPAAVAADADRLVRFQREAQVLAALNHPNIAAIYGLERSGDQAALVMELVEGDDLAQRVTRGAIPIDETLPIARQIADALDAAHTAGIIHRDLKPANIKVRDDGTVKVLDFGLAKALDQGSAIRDQGSAHLVNSPTVTTPAATQAGVILGTAAYMSPEQARGRAVDKRTDLWAFGCVLYEMLTGQHAFGGETVTDVLGAIVRAEPDWAKLPADTPAGVRRVLRRCLAKDVRARQQSAGDVRLDLDEAIAGSDAAPLAPASVPATGRLGWRSALGLAAASALAASGLTGLLTRPEPSAVVRPPVHRYTMDLPPGARLLGSGLNNAYNPAISPDGTQVVIAAWDQTGKRQLWRRALDGTAFEAMAGTDDGSAPAWSPDSTELVFVASGTLKRVSRQGGAPQAIAGVEALLKGVISTTISSPDWGPDGEILVATTDGVYRMTATGGQPVRVVPPTDAPSGPTPSGYAFPRWLPRNSGILFTTTIAGGVTEGSLEYVALPDGTPTRLLEVRGRGWMTPEGLILARATGRLTATLTAHRFDPATRSLEQPGVTLAADASLEFSASNTGTIVYRPGSGDADHRVEWVDANGRLDGEGFDVVGASPLNLSRDESLLAYMENGDILLRDLRRGVSTRLVPGPGVVEPVLSPDTRRIAYSTTGRGAAGVVVRPTAGGAPERVYETTQVALVEDWSSDGRFLAVNEGQKGLIVSLDGQQQPQTYADLPAGSSLDEPRFAPDGRWLVYNAADSGRQEVYLVPLPPTGERWQLSASGGAQGRWRRDGKVVFYLAPSGDLMAVDLDLTPGARPGIARPRALFATGLAMTPNIDQYAPNADGTRFLLRRPKEAEGTPRLNVIVNWPSLLPPR